MCNHYNRISEEPGKTRYTMLAHSSRDGKGVKKKKEIVYKVNKKEHFHIGNLAVRDNMSNM